MHPRVKMGMIWVAAGVLGLYVYRGGVAYTNEAVNIRQTWKKVPGVVTAGEWRTFKSGNRNTRRFWADVVIVVDKQRYTFEHAYDSEKVPGEQVEIYYNPNAGYLTRDVTRTAEQIDKTDAAKRRSYETLLLVASILSIVVGVLIVVSRFYQLERRSDGRGG